MTETGWMACRDPRRMLDFLPGRASDRKLRLCAVAYCRCVWLFLDDERSRGAVDAAEQFADAEVSDYQLMLARRNAEAVIRERTGQGEWAARAAAHTALPWADSAIRGVLTMTPPLLDAESIAPAGAVRCGLIREIVGNPFRPSTVDPAWRTARITSMAQAIYAERAFDRLPILGDALEEAGCTNAGMLDHCREPEGHVKGCWVIDLLLGKT